MLDQQTAAQPAASPYLALNLAEKLALINERWTPKVIAEMNDYQFKLVKLEGDFIWHAHAETDETFIVLDGQLRIDFRDGAVVPHSGEMFVLPTGGGDRNYRQHEA